MKQLLLHCPSAKYKHWSHLGWGPVADAGGRVQRLTVHEQFSNATIIPDNTRQATEGLEKM